MKHGLKETTIQKICAVLAHYPQVEQAVLYGSRAKGNYKNGSDIDLTLRGGADLTLNVVYKILSDLEGLFGLMEHLEPVQGKKRGPLSSGGSSRSFPSTFSV